MHCLSVDGSRILQSEVAVIVYVVVDVVYVVFAVVVDVVVVAVVVDVVAVFVDHLSCRCCSLVQSPSFFELAACFTFFLSSPNFILFIRSSADIRWKCYKSTANNRTKKENIEIYDNIVSSDIKVGIESTK